MSEDREPGAASVHGTPQHTPGHPSAEDPAVDQPASEQWVRVRLALGGVEIAFEGRRRFFEEHVTQLVDAAYARGVSGGPARAAEPEAAAVFKPASPQRFQKFAAQVGSSAATVEQRVMAFAFYLWNYERRDEFRPEEIAAFFRTVREEPPDDLEERVTQLAQAKRFLEAGSATQSWRLTTKGVNYVKNRLLGAA